MPKLTLEEQLHRRKIKAQEAKTAHDQELRSIIAAERKLAAKKREARWREMGQYLDAWGLLDIDPATLKGVLAIAQDMLLQKDHPQRTDRPMTTLVMVGEDGRPFISDASCAEENGAQDTP